MLIKDYILNMFYNFFFQYKHLLISNFATSPFASHGVLRIETDISFLFFHHISEEMLKELLNFFVI